MLEKIPSVIGEALHGLRAGAEKTAGVHSFPESPSTITVTSDSFVEGGPIPPTHTADGAGIEPPLRWSGCPAGTAEVVVFAEDADSPTPRPLVHLIAYGLPAKGGSNQGVGGRGLNSFGKAAFLPPDPPSGHGPHRYHFVVFALGEPSGLSGEPGRSATLDAMRGKVLAKGVLIGTCERP